MGQGVQAPDGTIWVVRRRWLPRLGSETLWGRFRRRSRRTRESLGDHVDLGDGCLVGTGEGLVAVVLAVVVIGLLVFVGIPLLVAAVEVVLIVIGGVLAVLARVLLGRPWMVEATSDRGEQRRLEVHGWRASQDQLAQMVDLLGAGLPIPGATSSTTPVDRSLGPDPHAREAQAIAPQAPSTEVDEPRPSRAGRARGLTALGLFIAVLAVVAGMLLGPRWF